MVFQNNILAGASGSQAAAYSVDESVRFNDDDSPRLERTPSAPGSRKTGSISFWYKRCNLGSIMQLFNSGAGDDITFNASNQLTWSDGSGLNYITTQLFRDPTAWGHLLFALDTTLASAGDRARIYHNGIEITAFGTETNPDQYDELEISNTVEQKIGANESDTEEFDGYLSQFYYVDGQQLTPTSFGEFDDYGVWRPIEFEDTTVGSFGGDLTKPNSGVTVSASNSSASADDAIDGDTGSYWSEGTSGTGAGATWQIVFGSAVAIRQITLSALAANNAADDIDIESYNGSSWDVIQNITPVKNTAVQIFAVADSTARTTWRLVLKAAISAPYSWTIEELQMFAVGTEVYGTNGFFLDFADSSALGNDVSGLDNDYTSSGLAANDQVSDSPTKNYATYNPLNFRVAGGVLSNGNLVHTRAATGYVAVAATIPIPTTGKWAFKIKITGPVSGSQDGTLGIYADAGGNFLETGAYIQGITDWYNTVQISAYSDGGFRYQFDGSGSSTEHFDGPAAATNDEFEFLVDRTAGTVDINKNGSAYGTQLTGLPSDTIMWPGSIDYQTNTTATFNYTPSDTDYLTLCTANLPEPVIKDGSEYFQATVYTGTGSSLAVNQSGNATFQPDMVWIKNMNGTASDPMTIFDVNRGATEYWGAATAGNSAETTNANTLTSFDSDGFTVGTGAAGWNVSGEKHVAWQWKAGGTGESLTAGTINTTATSVSTTAGISINLFNGNVTAGATFAHGLGKKPDFWIHKTMDTAEMTNSYNGYLGAHFSHYLGYTTAAYDSPTYWNDVEPTDTLITLHSTAAVNHSGGEIVNYAFVGVLGFSKFGYYTGSGAADGPFVYTGFKPAYIQIARTNSTHTQQPIYDSARSPYNEIDDQLAMFSFVAETTGSEEIDFLASGFKCRTADADINASGGIYSYRVWATHPFGGVDTTPATAF